MAPASLPVNLGFLPRAAATRFGERPALIDARSGAERPFAQFADRCDRIAGALLARGARPGERVMVLGHNCPEFLEAVFGALRAGLVAVPVDERVGTGAIATICRNARPKAIIAVGDNAPVAPEVPIRIGLEDYQSLIDRADGAVPTDEPPEASPAIIMHTSGSTGAPKGVILSHRAAMSGLRRNLPDSAGGDIKDIRQRSLLALPLGHEAAFSVAKYMLAYGGTTVLGSSFRAPDFLQSLAKYRCTHTLLVPAMAVLLLKETALLRSLDLSALQSIVIGSAACAPELLRSLTEAFPTAVVTQNYGLTECGQVFAQSYTRSGRAPFASVGRPVRGVEVRLDGDRGELWVKTPAMMSGVDNRATSNLADGWLGTGDVFSKDAKGYFYYHGRKDDLISCGGMNVFPLEVENVLCRHPAVLCACVVAIPHDIKGQVPAAMIVRRPGTNVLADELMAFYLHSGAAYARPRQIGFVNEMPLGPTGKVDRDAVRKALEAAATEGNDGS